MLRSFTLFFFLGFALCPPAGAQKPAIYLFPGQGADQRQFRNIIWPEECDTFHMHYPLPDKGESMHEFACRFIPLIQKEIPFILVGVSLGGMICTELADTLDPHRTIVISSAKSRNELPRKYSFMQSIPANRLIPAPLTKAGAQFLQGIVEPDRRHEKETFKDMLKQKDPLYLKRTVDMIVGWERVTWHPDIIHIHGDRDHTLPIDNVCYHYLVHGGSHMMVLTRGGEISEILQEILQ